MSKPRFVISCPFDTYSGYGARARDIVKAIIDLDKYKVELLSQRWGETSWGFCNQNPEWNFLLGHLAKPNWQQQKPDIWMQITIPNEFQPVGKYNIGLTAGIEATACKPEWVEGMNRMDLNLVSSDFSKVNFENMVYEKKNPQTQQVMGQIKLTKPIKTVFEGVNLDIYKTLKSSEIKNINLKEIDEQFCFLFVGHWMNGDLGHDRKNVGLLVKSFYETFKDKRGPKPALILKASTGVSSYISRDQILNKIKEIRKSVKSSNLPNVYLLSGEFSDQEMNELYNHPKVKAMLSLTKGEGFGRPLLEFGLTGKPIMASGWSGHMDFLNPEYTSLLPGTLEPVHKSAANAWLIKEAKWFKVSEPHVGTTLKNLYKHYKKFLERARKQKHFAKSNFSWENMRDLVGTILEDNLPEFAEQVQLQMPKLELPKLEKLK
jgi:hypothetical protein|tara:strand:+ start:618 stop:1913 length:1296 start_codon:yes stop_codon:yes gene_type:complete